MDNLRNRILKLFDQMNSDTLDLHTLFEAGGNDPRAREKVIDVVARLVRERAYSRNVAAIFTP